MSGPQGGPPGPGPGVTGGGMKYGQHPPAQQGWGDNRQQVGSERDCVCVCV